MDLSFDALRTLYAEGDSISSVLSPLQIESKKNTHNAFISINDIEYEKFDPTKKLSGIPIAIKDNICTKGIKTTAASKMLGNFVPPYDATVIRKLKAAGAVLVGKTNMDEFAMGSSNENSAFGKVLNAKNQAYVPGGSSGGSATAVAAQLCSAALGSDTGGSIRQPANFSGVVGMKPTYGRVSRYGLIAFASSLDQVGPLTHTVKDAAEVLEVISGFDTHDMTSSKNKVPEFTTFVGKDIEGMRIGVPKQYFDIDGENPTVDASVCSATRDAILALEKRGAKISSVSLPHTKYAVSTYYLIATAEASSNLSRFDGVRFGHRSEEAENLNEMYEKSRSEGFGEEVKRRIMLGTYVLSAGFYDAYYRKAQRVRTLITDDFRQVFDKVDTLLTPVAPSPAFRFGEKTDDPLQMYLADIFTISCNLAGLPGISVPFSESAEGLPIGVQLLAPWWEDGRLFQVGRQLELARGEK